MCSTPNPDYLPDEHSSFIYSGQNTISGSAHPCSIDISQQEFSPEYIKLKLSCSGTGDSAQISKATIQSRYDTITFIDDKINDTSRHFVFPIRSIARGYGILILNNDIADTCDVKWSLIAE